MPGLFDPLWITSVSRVQWSDARSIWPTMAYVSIKSTVIWCQGYLTHYGSRQYQGYSDLMPGLFDRLWLTSVSRVQWSDGTFDSVVVFVFFLLLKLYNWLVCGLDRGDCDSDSETPLTAEVFNWIAMYNCLDSCICQWLLTNFMLAIGTVKYQQNGMRLVSLCGVVT